MDKIRLPKAVCAAVNNVLQGSHASLDILFITAGAPGEPPNLAHASKWKEWLFRAGQDPNVDSLAVLGTVIEEFMDLSPKADDPAFPEWKSKRDKLVEVLEEYGFRYYRGGRVLPLDRIPENPNTSPALSSTHTPSKPEKVSDLLETLIKGLRRAMHPLTHRRKGAQALSFSTEYDVQDLLHALLRPWVVDIRPEEFTPSHAGSSTRMDFLLPKHKLVIELKFVRDGADAKKIGNDLIVDIDHYRRHPDCKELWCVIFDQAHLLTNPEGLRTDLEGASTTRDGTILVKVMVL